MTAEPAGVNVVRSVHVVSAVTEEASGPSYSVVRLCDSLISAGAEAVSNRPKTGFGIPMMAISGTPWARRWAKTILDRMPGCE